MNVDPALLETIEAQAWVDLYAAAPPSFAAAAGLSAMRISDVTVLALASVPQTQFNRILGIGIERAATEANLDAVLARMRTAGNASFFLHLAPAARPRALAGWLSARGLVPYHRSWGKFHRTAEPAPAIATPLRVEEVEPDRAMDFARPVAMGFGAPPPFMAWLAVLPGRPGWRVFAAYDGGDAVAGGALYIRGPTAWLGIAATIPAQRGRGAQGAIMARRIAAAIDAGCTGIATETGTAVPGEPNPSYNNMLRCGFTVAYLRDNYVAAPP